MLRLMTTLWRSWKGFAHGLIRAQNTLIMGAAYWLALGPISIIIKANRNLRLDREPADPTARTYGQPARVPPSDIRRAQRPF